MTFGEKLKNTRLAQNLSQIELAEKTGITERSIYSYEQTGTFPRANVLKKIADALTHVRQCIDEQSPVSQIQGGFPGTAK